MLLLTLYATQYSGNILISLSANASRSGFSFLVSVLFIEGAIGVYAIDATGLHRLSRDRGYITLSDHLQDRYRSRVLSVLVSLSGIVALANEALPIGLRRDRGRMLNNRQTTPVPIGDEMA